ncbi:Ribokinase-like protein, partial [Flagelloscypha sp. PMI_526]
TMSSSKHFVSLGMFIVDEFSFKTTTGESINKSIPSQVASAFTIGGGGTYAALGARIWLSAEDVGMIVDRGNDWGRQIPRTIRKSMFGKEMWLFRDDPSRVTTRALNAYVGDVRNFEYLTPKIRITPSQLLNTPLQRPNALHFVCSPTRALEIMKEVREVEGWHPVTIFEPIPDRCIPAELPALKQGLCDITILSPNAEEALSLLSISGVPNPSVIENAAQELFSFSPRPNFSVVIRSGHLGAFVLTSSVKRWIPAYWNADEPVHQGNVVDVTGAGNSFLGGLAAGLKEVGDVFEASLFATVSASFIVEQQGLPLLSCEGSWNGDDPRKRLQQLRTRLT